MFVIKCIYLLFYQYLVFSDKNDVGCKARGVHLIPGSVQTKLNEEEEEWRLIDSCSGSFGCSSPVVSWYAPYSTCTTVTCSHQLSFHCYADDTSFLAPTTRWLYSLPTHFYLSIWHLRFDEKKMPLQLPVQRSLEHFLAMSPASLMQSHKTKTLKNILIPMENWKETNQNKI